MKAIQTFYKGYYFRSRLEARWAVFFDALKLDWTYEVEGYELPSGRWYLPDFLVKTPQGGDIWYEVKPTEESDDGKLKEFHQVLHKPFDDWVEDLKTTEKIPTIARAAMLTGDPMAHIGRLHVYRNGLKSNVSICPRCGLIGHAANGEYGDMYGCEACDFETPCGGGHPYETGVLGIKCTPHKGMVVFDSNDYVTFKKRIVYAAVQARSARFEHGQSGPTIR
jgi:hypothetical protein